MSLQFHRAPSAFGVSVSLLWLAMLVTTSAAQQKDPGKDWKEEDSKDDRWSKMDIGPFLASVVKSPHGDIAKGLSIKVGEKQQAAVCYDTGACAMRFSWTGGFLKFNPRRYGISDSPGIAGDVQLVCARAGWGEGKPQYQGLYQNGDEVVLSYVVDGVAILERPAARVADGVMAVRREFHIAPHNQMLVLTLLERAGKATIVKQATHVRCVKDGRTQSVAITSSPSNVSLQHKNDSLTLHIGPSEKPVAFVLWMSACPSDKTESAERLFDVNENVNLPRSIEDGENGGQKTVWPKWVAAGGQRGEGDGPLVVDTINVPFDNPYKALMFTSGLDFFSNGDVAVSTLHGDVWLVRGVDDDLADVKWKRYATGLCQPLGLKIVDEKIYVLGKDQITRLHDRNGDNEADFYECFNNAGQTSVGGHDFAACLETDAEGNFYYIRAHEGVCRVSADGAKHESIATGFRNPNGLGVSPAGPVTAAPQEGNWTPASAIFAIREGGYYGFGGPRKGSPFPLGFEPPLCWMPRTQDNSSGGQVWVTSDKWGLPRGTMLHLSYGQCTAHVVMHEEVPYSVNSQGNGGPKFSGKLHQGGTVKLPLYFESGVCRGRFSPHDGQLYLCGLMGWQTSAAKDGCLERVRHTGKPVHMPVGLQVRDGGIAITFNHPLDPKSAADPDNYYIEQWNYQYSKDYGSKEYRVSEPKKFGRDEVYIDDAQLSNDNRTVFLKLEELAPVMQMAITYQIKAADGAELKETIYNTVNVVRNSK